jgi:hypothetical protein
MSRTAKTDALGRAPFHRLSDGEILLFVSSMLQLPLDDASRPRVVAKLRSLKDLLDRQEATLPELPDCPGKRRMGDALTGAKTLVGQISDALTGTAKLEPAVRQAQSA